MERELVHEALEKIVKEELRKVAADAVTAAKEGLRGEKESRRVSSEDDYRRELLKESREMALHQQNGTTSSTTLNGGSGAANKENVDDAESEREYNSRKFVKMIGEFAASAALAHVQKANGKRKKQGKINGKTKEDEAVTELHIIEDGWEPYERSRFAGTSFPKQSNKNLSQLPFFHLDSLYSTPSMTNHSQLGFARDGTTTNRSSSSCSSISSSLSLKSITSRMARTAGAFFPAESFLLLFEALLPQIVVTSIDLSGSSEADSGNLECFR